MSVDMHPPRCLGCLGANLDKNLHISLYIIVQIVPALADEPLAEDREGWDDQGDQMCDAPATHSSTSRPAGPARASAAGRGSRDRVVDLATRRRVPRSREFVVLWA